MSDSLPSQPSPHAPRTPQEQRVEPSTDAGDAGEASAPTERRNAITEGLASIRRRLRVRLLWPEALARVDIGAFARRLAEMPPRRLAALATMAVAGVTAFAIFVVVGVSAVSALSAQFGYHPKDEAAVWAALKPRFAVATTCANCHAREGVKWATSEHDVVPCQSCHGPMEGHDQAGPVSYTALSELQSRKLCAACHAKAEGRPDTVAQIDIDAHFTPGGCAMCHDPHTTDPVRPPKIPHILQNLPACSTCHGSTGNRPVPPTHPVYPSDLCQKCHAPLTES